MKALEKCWHPVAWSSELKEKPIEATILGKNIVVFRDANGKPRVMNNKCLHKGVKLSKGRCRNGNIQCPYHGWEYDGEGRISDIPSQVHKDTLPAASIPVYQVVEQQDTIWCCFSDAPYEKTPIDWHYYERKHFFATTFDMDSNYVLLLENLVENTHARFIHDGLLRNSQKITVVNALVKKTASGVHSQTFGEKASGSLLYRIFGDATRELDHIEEYLTPNIIRIIFGQDKKIHIASQLVCVPVDEEKTRIFFRVALECKFAALLLPLLKAMLVQGILTQDGGILKHETQVNRNAKGNRQLTASDIPASWVGAMAREFAINGPEASVGENTVSKQITYQL